MADEFIGNYKILRKIGAGGMASVFLAVHKDVPNLRVVLKLLSDPRLVERFKQEADKLALLDGHGHICQIKHFFQHGEEMVIAMEYIDGATLEDLILQEKRVAVEQAVKIISDVLETLTFAHEKGVFHRDIKPSNIMVDRNGQVKIIDFGIAKADTDPNLTQAGSACGTPSYMAPEQFNPSDDINYALVDVYAVGTTLFCLLTGETPFKGDNPFALRDAKLFNDPPRPSDINPAIPREVERVILKAIDKDPEKRYHSMAEMKADLNQTPIKTSHVDITEALPPMPPPGSGMPTPPPPYRKKGKGKAIGIIGVLVIIAAAVVGYFAFIAGDKLPAPILLNPTDGGTVSGSFVTFVWEAPAGIEGTYTLEYSEDEAFSDPSIYEEIRTASYTPVMEFDNLRYFWRVRLVDKGGNKSDYSPIQSFIVQTVPGGKKQGNLNITIKPEGDIYINGQLQGKNKKELDISLDSGQYSIRVDNAASAEKSRTQTVSIAPGSDESINFTFSIPPPPPQATYGDLKVSSAPFIDGDVYIDDILQDRKTPNTYRIKTGLHRVRVVLYVEGQERSKTDTITITEDRLGRLDFQFD